jgi:hypothetical protein
VTRLSHRSMCPSRHLLRAAIYAAVISVLPEFLAPAQDTVLPPHLVGPGAEALVVTGSVTRADAAAAQVSPERLILVPSSNSAGDNLGLAVALNGQTAVAGAWLSGRAGPANSGAAHVFERHHPDTDAWGEIRTLTASSPSSQDRFGVSTAIDGDVIVVGAYLDDTAGRDAGAAYVYERNQGGPQNWGQVAVLTANDAAPDDRFGVSVAIDGDVIVVGAFGKDLGQADVGAAYVFRRDGNEWVQAARLTHQSGLAGDELGISVAVSVTNVAVGAWGRAVAGGSDAGAVYLFQLGAGTNWTNWTRGPMLLARNPASASWFGRSLCMDSDILAVGARGVGAQTNSGSVSIFQHSETNWTNVASIVAPAGAVNDHFGISVALNTNNLAVGAFGTQSVYTYTNSIDGVWQQGVPIIHHGEGFGLSVALDQAGIFIGAYLDDHMGADAGAAYIEIGNSTPRATNDTFSVFEDSTLSTNVLGNDFDSDDVGGALSAFLISPPTNTAAFVFNPDGSFIYTPRSNSISPDSFTYYVSDGGLTSSVARAVIAVIPVNDPPSFAIPTNHISFEDQGLQTIAGWATSIDAGAADEASQALNFLVSTSPANLFSVQPAISPTGTLSYMTASNASGVADVIVALRDDVGGVSPQKTFSIIVSPVNDPPGFTIGPDITVAYNSGPQNVLWVQNITAGPGETNQMLTFSITPTNSPLFGIQPSVNSNGYLTFAAEGGSGGTGVFNLILRDTGGTANGGRNTSEPQPFVVTIVTNPPPILKITDLGGYVVLSWPLGLQVNPVLQARTSLAQSWANTPSGPTNFPVVKSLGRAQFFRLGTSP